MSFTSRRSTSTHGLWQRVPQNELLVPYLPADDQDQEDSDDDTQDVRAFFCLLAGCRQAARASFFSSALTATQALTHRLNITLT